MKPKLLFTIASILYFLGGLFSFFQPGGFDYYLYSLGVLSVAIGILFWLVRDAPASKTLNAVFLTGTLASGLGALVALYGQFSGTYMDTPVGYVPGLIYLALAAGFFLVGRANMSMSA